MRHGFLKKDIAFPAYLIITVVYITALLVFFRQSYWINDDLGILADIKSDCLVSFMSVLLGKFLSLLYLNVSDRIAWYGIVLYLLAAVSIFLTLYSIDKVCLQKWLKTCLIALLLIASARFFLRIGYTTVSLNIGFSSLFALLVYRRISKKPNAGIVLLLGACFSLSFLVRKIGVQGVIVFSLGILIWELFWEFRKKGWVLILFFVPLIIVVLTNNLYEERATGEARRRYQAWNDYRRSFHNFPIAIVNQKNAALLEKNNWSVNDYRMLRKWLYFDENKFNPETLQNIFIHSPPLLQKNHLDISRILSKSIRLWISHPPFTSMLVLVLLVSVFTLNKWRLLYFCAYLVYVFLGAAAMQLFYRFPLRIAFPIFLGVAIMGCYFVFIENREVMLTPRWNKNSIRKYLIWGVGCCLLTVGISDLPRTKRRIADIARYQEIYYANRTFLEALKADFLIIQPNCALYSSYRDPLKVHTNTVPSVPAGWPIFSPRFYKALQQIGLKHGYEVLPRTVDQPRVYLVGKFNYPEYIVTFLKENHKIDCRYEQTDKINEEVGVFRIVTR